MAFFQTRPFSACDQRSRIARGVNPSLMNDRHVAAQIAHVGDDVRGENDDDVLADGAEQVVKAHALFGIEAGGGLVDDDEPRISQQRLRDAEALLHAAGKAAQRLVAVIPEIGLPQQRLHHVAPLLGVLDAFQRGEMRQQTFGRDLGIESELLRQDSQASCALHLSGASTSMPSMRALPLSASCSVASVRMSVDLPAPFGPSSPNMPCGMDSETSCNACVPLG